MTEPVYRRTALSMGTLVTIEVVGHSATPTPEVSGGLPHVQAAVERAFDWFHQIEECCSRFDPQSELSRLSATVGIAVPVSAVLFQAVQFALAIAEETCGAFDPTVGAAMESRGFNRNYRTGQTVRNALLHGYKAAADYRDVRLDPDRKTITLLRPLLLDLGAVAKGLAIDMAAHELSPLANFVINAGGDVYVAGHNWQGEPWSVGIRHPRIPGALIDSLHVSDCAVCTSGDYERRCPDSKSDGTATRSQTAAVTEPSGHHIIDPRAGRSPLTAASATVVAPTAMLADALATAAFVLGPAQGIALLERLGTNGLIISPALDRYATRGMRSDYESVNATIFPDAQRIDASGAGRTRDAGSAV